MNIKINKKYFILVLMLLILIISFFIIKTYNEQNKYNKYQKIKENIQNDIERVLYIIYPHCEVGKTHYGILFEESQNDYYGVDKKKLLDIDGKSYCKIRAKARCVSKDTLEWDTYIKCKDYEDVGYNVEK